MSGLPRSSRTARLPGTLGRRGRDRARRGRLHDRDDRLPGDRHRPELRRAARLLHGADGRQLRRRAGALRVGPARTPARCSCARPGARPGPTGSPSRASSRSTRSTRARSSCACASAARCAPPPWRAGCARADVLDAVRAQPPMAGRALVAGVSTPESSVGRAAAARASPSSTTGASARSSRRLVAAGASVTVLSARRRAEEVLAAGPDGVLLSNGPGDPAALADEVAAVRALLGPRARSSASASATSCSPSRPASRRSSCRFGHRGANHPVLDTRNEPRARHRARTTASPSKAAATRSSRTSRSTTAPWRGSRCPDERRPLGAVPSRGGPGPARRLAAHRRLGRGAERLAQAA